MFEVGDIVRVVTEPPANRHGTHWMFISEDGLYVWARGYNHRC